MGAIPLQRGEIYYPESDGQPMGESDLHREEMTYLIKGLQEHFRRDPEVYVAGNLFFYYKKGDPRSVVAPDVFVIKGVSSELRRTYKLWEEGESPCLVIEVTSDSTQDEDLDRKKVLYERLGVEEYFLFDPLGDYLSPRLQGYRLAGDRYQPAAAEADGSLKSLTTGVTFRLEGQRARLVKTATGEPILRFEESEAARRAAEERVRTAEERNRSLEEEVARLRRELQRGGNG